MIRRLFQREQIKNKRKFIFLIALLLTLFAVAKFTPVGSYIDRETISQLVENTGPYGPLVFIGIYTIAAVTFLPGTPLTLASGVLFGSVKGALYVIIGATIGATLAFFIARFFGEDFVERFLKNRFRKIYEYDEKIERNGFMVMLFLRLIPLFPFNGLNFAMGLTKIKPYHYVLGTFLGIIPGTFVYANVGSAAASGFLTPQFLISIALLGLLILILPLYKYARKKRSKILS